MSLIVTFFVFRDISALENSVKTMDVEKLEMQKVLKSIQESLSIIARRNTTSPVNFATSTVPSSSSRRQLPPGFFYLIPINLHIIFQTPLNQLFKDTQA